MNAWHFGRVLHCVTVVAEQLESCCLAHVWHDGCRGAQWLLLDRVVAALAQMLFSTVVVIVNYD